MLTRTGLDMGCSRDAADGDVEPSYGACDSLRRRGRSDPTMHLTQRLFACAYDPVMAPLEHGRVGAQRTALLAGAHGHVLDLGAGTGANLDHLPATVDRVTAVE